METRRNTFLLRRQRHVELQWIKDEVRTISNVVCLAESCNRGSLQSRSSLTQVWARPMRLLSKFPQAHGRSPAAAAASNKGILRLQDVLNAAPQAQHLCTPCSRGLLVTTDSPHKPHGHVQLRQHAQKGDQTFSKRSSTNCSRGCNSRNCKKSLGARFAKQCRR